MCGILATYTAPVDENFINQFNAALSKMAHRGPDADGVWFDSDHAVALGHRRLSILDLSSAGQQPMFSHNQRWVIVFNGEIYNWQDLRKRLEGAGILFQTTSDTEVLLEALDQWGTLKTLESLVGMFAFAVWDREQKRFYIARDRLGEKPLYYSRLQTGWAIASELKALKALPGFDTTLNPQALQLFLRKKYIPEPHSIYQNTYKLPPGTFAEITEQGNVEIRPYWQFEEAVHQGLANPFNDSFDDAVSELEHLLTESIRLQRVADVPVGAFLSGGIDSSLVVSLMQAQGGPPVHTFSIGFEDKHYDESGYARDIAKHLGTTHTEQIVTAEETRSVIPQLSSMYDEPYADASAIPTHLVSKLARKDVTVSLSGDAGDELFGGYTRYQTLQRIWQRLRFIPRPARRFASLLSNTGASMAYGLNQNFMGYQLSRKQRQFALCNKGETYQGQMEMYGETDVLLKDIQPAPLSPHAFHGLSDYHLGMAVDTLDYLPGDILTKVDRAAMACSLETRIPLLDHRIVEFAWRLPEHYKIDKHETKKPLRALLEKHVPRQLFERPKKGFGVPVGDWVRGPLKPWAEDLFSTESLKQTNVFHPARVQALWHAHRDGRMNEPYRIWSLLMLQNWLIQNETSN